mmetsp:Transcript_106885/g.330197  ORF Transcript_106885/g.330197 Transcript_106885/m.330197 type:complete len:470 (-) Transcript_106885:20-1429(-)
MRGQPLVGPHGGGTPEPWPEFWSRRLSGHRQRRGHQRRREPRLRGQGHLHGADGPATGHLPLWLRHRRRGHGRRGRPHRPRRAARSHTRSRRHGGPGRQGGPRGREYHDRPVLPTATAADWLLCDPRSGEVPGGPAAPGAVGVEAASLAVHAAAALREAQLEMPQLLLLLRDHGFQGHALGELQAQLPLQLLDVRLRARNLKLSSRRHRKLCTLAIFLRWGSILLCAWAAALRWPHTPEELLDSLPHGLLHRLLPTRQLLLQLSLQLPDLAGALCRGVGGRLLGGLPIRKLLHELLPLCDQIIDGLLQFAPPGSLLLQLRLQSLQPPLGLAGLVVKLPREGADLVVDGSGQTVLGLLPHRQLLAQLPLQLLDHAIILQGPLVRRLPLPLFAGQLLLEQGELLLQPAHQAVRGLELFVRPLAHLLQLLLRLGEPLVLLLLLLRLLEEGVHLCGLVLGRPTGRPLLLQLQS